MSTIDGSNTYLFYPCSGQKYDGISFYNVNFGIDVNEVNLFLNLREQLMVLNGKKSKI
jgi:hypothetical protein